jgi:hypothetical protein
MKKIIFSIIVLVSLVGCGTGGSDTASTTVVEGSAVLPYDINTSIVNTSNVSNITFGDGSMYVLCDNGANCAVTLGDTSSATDNSVVYNSVVDNNSSKL